MRNRLIRIVSVFVLLTQTCISLAAVLPITVTFLGGTTNFSTNRQGTANYKVAVDPGVIPPNWSLTFSLASAGNSTGLTVSQITAGPSPCSGVSNGLCGSTFSLFAGQSCCLAFSLSSSAVGNYSLQPIIQTTPPAYSAQATSASSVNVTTASGLSTSVSMLALSVNCQPASSCTTTQNAQLTGQARQITVRNTGPIMATGLTINYPSWPSGTTATSTCGSTLAAGASCTITITPGATATSGTGGASCATGISPIPGLISINADNANTITTHVEVLTYGCIYQGGFVYSVDDTTPATGSIGGKTAAISDTFAAGFPVGVGPPNWGGYGTDVGSSTYETDPSGANNGSANTATIISVLNCASPNNTDVAACLCNARSVNTAGSPSCISPSTCYTGWYLPAICELAPATPFGAACTPGSTNIQDQLFDASPAITSLGLLNMGFYWSSTESSISPTLEAWTSRVGDSSAQGSATKDLAFGIRCSRALTPP